MADQGGNGEGRAGSGRSVVTDPTLIAILVGSASGAFGVQAVPPAIPAISTDLAVSDARIGLVFTVFYLATGVASPAVGAIVDLYGRRRPFLLSLVLFGVSGVATVFVETFPALLALRALQGVTFAGVTPITVALVGDLYEGSAASTAQGIRTSSHGIAGIAGPAIAGFLAGFSWHYPFLIYGLAFPAAAFVYLYLPRIVPDDDADADDADADDESAGGVSSPAVRSYLRSIGTELRSPRLSVLILGIGTVYFVKTGLIAFIPLFAVRVLDVSPFAAGALLSLRGVARITASPLTGQLTGRLPRTWTLYLIMGLLVVPPFLFSVANSFVALAVLFGLYSIGDAVGVPFFHDTITAMTALEQRAGVVSFMNTFKLGANAASPAFFGLVLSVSSFDGLFVAVSAVAVGYTLVGVAVFELFGSPEDAMTEPDAAVE